MSVCMCVSVCDCVHERVCALCTFQNPSSGFSMCGQLFKRQQVLNAPLKDDFFFPTA